MSFDSAEYWRKRYASGGNSGAGSYGALADFKAASLNSFIAGHEISSATEYGSGDGNQLSLLQIKKYVGLDVSPVAIENLKVKFVGDSTKEFFAYDPDNFLPDDSVRSEIALSMDVILHLTEDFRYEKYMSNLVASTTKYLGIFNTATETQLEKMAQHNRYRDHRIWISARAIDFREVKVDLTPPELGYPANTGFFFYERI
jgi:hypothetical protein